MRARSEDEAKGLFCPLGAPDRDEAMEPIIRTNCCGSRCMMWRSVESLDGQDIIRGYCGLAGKP